METLRLVLLFVHILGYAALLGGLLVQVRDDTKSVNSLMRDGAGVLTRDQVMEGVSEMLPIVQIEATFPDGTRLVTVHKPIR